MLSVRNRSTQGFLGVRERCRARAAPAAPRRVASCFYALMDAVVDRYFPIIDALEAELETIEDQIFEPGVGRARTSSACTR